MNLSFLSTFIVTIMDSSSLHTANVLSSQINSQPKPKSILFGMDATQLTTTIIVPFLIAVFTVWLTLKLRDRLRVKIVSKLNKNKFNELVALYIDRVPDYERVPPDHFKAFFKTSYTSSSSRNFRKRVKLNSRPVHLLLIAQTSQGICGFLKVIFIPNICSLFIAYLVTAVESHLKKA